MTDGRDLPLDVEEIRRIAEETSAALAVDSAGTMERLAHRYGTTEAPAPTEEPPPEPLAEPPEDEPDTAIPVPGTWQPRPLIEYAASAAPAAEQLPVQGGRGLLYRGRSNAAYGEPGSGKSWLVGAATVATLRADPASWVLLLDLEDSPDLWATRFAQVGMPADELRRIAYARPREPLAVWAGLVWLVRRSPALVALDGVTEFYQLHGLDSANAEDTARVMRNLDALTHTGAALLLADHVTKDRTNRRFAAGSQHKLAAVTGAAYRIEADPDIPIRRHHMGSSRLVLTKDRPGGIPCRVEHEAARLILDDRRRPGHLWMRPGEDWG